MDNEIKEAFIRNLSLFRLQGVSKKDLVLLKLQGKQSSNGSIIILLINSKNRKPVGVAKIPRNPNVVAHLETECNCINELQGIIHDKDILQSIPNGCVMENAGMREVIIQGACTGTPMVRYIRSDKANAIADIYDEVFEWAMKFHLARSESVTLNRKMITEHVVKVVEWVKENKSDLYQKLNDKSRKHLDALPDKIEDRKCMLMHQHGDFNVYNLLADDKSGKRFYVIDWEDYQKKALPIHDINHFFITNANLIRGRGTVNSFSSLLSKNGWYNDLYNKTVQSYVSKSVFDKDLFFLLSPLYFMAMIKRVSSEARQEEHTATVWVDLCNLYVDSYC